MARLFTGQYIKLHWWTTFSIGEPQLETTATVTTSNNISSGTQDADEGPEGRRGCGNMMCGREGEGLIQRRNLSVSSLEHPQSASLLGQIRKLNGYGPGPSWQPPAGWKATSTLAKEPRFWSRRLIQDDDP